jgi:hypothetical protein
MANSQAQKNITRSFVGEGPVANIFLVGNAATFYRCVATCDPLALVGRGNSSFDRGNAQLGNGPFADLIRG